jgi:hypothetical protein
MTIAALLLFNINILFTRTRACVPMHLDAVASDRPVANAWLENIRLIKMFAMMPLPLTVTVPGRSRREKRERSFRSLAN